VLYLCGKFSNLNAYGFMPHGFCFEWRPGVLWLHVCSDLGIAVSYYAIAFTMFYFIRQRRDLPFQPLFWLFGTFILLCGTTHLLAVWVLWHPNYYIEGYVKAATALVSAASLVVTIIVLPKALGLRGAAEISRENLRLEELVALSNHAATHDAMTGLPNRHLLHDRIEQAIAMAPRHGTKVALLFLDLDGFKHINDSLGHSTGDKLLKSVTSRLTDCVRASDTVSRQGGDEFVVLLAEMNEAADAGVTARRFLQVLGDPHSIDGHELQVSVSIGISIFPDDGLDAETLIKAADAAMYRVKESGRNGYQYFDAAMRTHSIERQYIEEGLRRALKNDEFELHYQPKIDIGSGAITGAEALIRWTHPERGTIPPAAFIPVAENCGLIAPLGKWVLRKACEQGRLWMDAGLPPITMAVNVSPLQLGRVDFLETLLGILDETGFDPKYLELEMTEGVLMKRAAATDVTLKTLKTTGLRLAIDDFGTGYCSLSYLTKFPIDTIKIDKSFVREISTAPAETAIVTAVISMAHSLNLVVVAEGVETREEFEFLANLGCDEAQGYYFSRPVPAASFTALLEGTSFRAHQTTTSGDT
jgi:diguanylate cyclase (GGDEF)-like protein